jgi:hypothetical protein
MYNVGHSWRSCRVNSGLLEKIITASVEMNAKNF